MSNIKPKTNVRAKTRKKVTTPKGKPKESKATVPRAYKQKFFTNKNLGYVPKPSPRVVSVGFKLNAAPPPMKDDSVNFAQQQVTEIPCTFHKGMLQQLCMAYPLFAISRGIVANKMVLTSAGLVEAKYLMYATLLYDAWKAMNAEFTLFSKAPKQWYVLRDLISPTTENNYAYNFVTPGSFFGIGGLFPTGVPLRLGNISLAWPTDLSQPLSPLFNVVPLLTTVDLETIGVQTCVDLWNILASQNSIILSSYSETKYKATSAVYGQARSSVGSTWENVSLKRSSFYGSIDHECEIQPEFQWAMRLDLVQDSAVDRSPTFVHSGFLGAINYNDRVVNDVGEHSIPRSPFPVYIDVEDVMQHVFMQIVASQFFRYDVRMNDGQMQNKDGSNAITGGQFISDLRTISQAELLYAIWFYVQRQFLGANFVGAFSLPTADIYTLAGTQIMPDATMVPVMEFASFAERKGDMSPMAYEDGRIAYPVLHSLGKFRIHYSMNADAADVTNFNGAVSDLYPDFDEVVDCPFGSNTSGLPDNIDPTLAGTTSLTQGSAFTPITLKYSTLMRLIVGNTIQFSGFVDHKNRSVTDYAKFCSYTTNGAWSYYGNSTLGLYAHRDEFFPGIMAGVTSAPLNTFFLESADDYLALIGAYRIHSRIPLEEPELLAYVTTEGASNYVRPAESEFSVGIAMAMCTTVNRVNGSFAVLPSLISKVIGGIKRGLDSGVPQNILNKINSFLNKPRNVANTIPREAQQLMSAYPRVFRSVHSFTLPKMHKASEVSRKRRARSRELPSVKKKEPMRKVSADELLAMGLVLTDPL